MPFIKKTGSQAVQPLNDARTLFIGRMGELLFFVQNILKPEEPTHNIISISGQGGVGKSTLLTRYIAETQAPHFKDSCLTAFVDERQTSPVSIMQKFADQLHLEGEFKKVLNQYEEALLKLKTDPENEALHDAALGGVPNFAGAVVEGVPIVGPMLREGVKVTAQYLLARYYTNLVRGDAERLRDPVADLTRAFVEELNRLVDFSIVPSSRQTKRRRVILFFDTFEQLADEAVPWLLNYFLPANISSNVVLVAAGRTPIEHSTSDPKRWLPYYDSGTIYSISLNNFTQDETRDYLAERSITEPDRINTIWQLSQGLPLYLGLLTSNPRSKVDPTKDVVANFLRWIPEQDQLKKRLALDAALLSRPFNQDDLEAFKYLPENDRSAMYDWLTELPFMRSQDGRYRYHELVQDLFSRHLYQRSKKEYYATHRAVADYYQHVLEEIQQQEGESVYDTLEWLELQLALTYQLFFLPDEASHIKAIEYTLRAYKYAKQSGEIVKILHELSKEQSTKQAASNARQTAKQLLQYIESDLKSQEFITSANALLEKVAHDSTFSSEMLSTIYRSRGLAYRRLEDYEQSIADFDRAIALNPNRADIYRSRGRAYYKLQDYQRAIEDFNHALELDPKDDWAYGRRGYTYYKLQDYQRAIEDFNHALELDPKDSWRYIQRGRAYHKLQDYQWAIEDFNRALKLDPKDDWAYAHRGYAYYKLQDYQRAIEDFNHALELDPKDVWVCSRKGSTYLRMKDIEQAQSSYAKCWEMDATHIRYGWMAEWTGMCNERPDPGMTQRLERIAASDPESDIAYVCRAVALWLHKSLEQSLMELEQAILLEPEEWGAYFWKGMVCAALRRDEDAKAAVEKSLEVDMPPVLLAPLRWFEQDRPDFYDNFVVPLLVHYV